MADLSVTLSEIEVKIRKLIALKNQLKEEKFIDWQYESLSMRDACEREWITVEEYIDFNESYFPNRKKKETK